MGIRLRARTRTRSRSTSATCGARPRPAASRGCCTPCAASATCCARNERRVRAADACTRMSFRDRLVLLVRGGRRRRRDARVRASRTWSCATSCASQVDDQLRGPGRRRRSRRAQLPEPVRRARACCVLPPAPLGGARGLRADRAARRHRDPARAAPASSCRSTSARSRSPPGDRERVLQRHDDRRRARARLHGAAADRATPSRPCDRSRTSTARCAGSRSRWSLVSLGGVALAVWLGLAGRARGAAAGEAAHRRRRARRAHARPQPPDRGRRHRRAQPARARASTRCSRRSTSSAARAAPARRRRLARAAHAAHEPAHEHRGARRGRRAPAARTASGCSRDVVAQLDELTVLVTDLVDLARGDEPAAVARGRAARPAGRRGGRARAAPRARQALRDRARAVPRRGRAGAPRPGGHATCSTTPRSGARPAARSR